MYALIDPERASGNIKDLLDATRQQLGRVPNLYRAMANSPHGLAAYLAFRAALQGGMLDGKMRERIALLTAQLNACDYCVAAHALRAQRMGLSEQDIADTRRGNSELPKIDAALVFVSALIRGHGSTPVATREALSAHGWSESEIGEMIAHVALNVFSNYFKQVAEPALDFPVAPALLP